jgi:phage shock protein PspC (stress-responsive transcriptional regulator)
VVGFFAYKHIDNRTLSIAAVVLACMISALSVVNTDYFARLHATSVEKGVSYRMNIYRMATGEILDRNIVIGSGPGVLPTDLNNIDMAPEDIAKTLDEGLIFISAHDLLLDFALYFGLIAASLLFLLFVWALFGVPGGVGNFGITTPYVRLYFIVLLMNAAYNTISPEILVLTIVTMLHLLIVPEKAKVIRSRA